MSDFGPTEERLRRGQRVQIVKDTPAWQAKMKEMVPCYGQKLSSDPVLANRIRQYSSKVLGLNVITLDAPPIAQR